MDLATYSSKTRSTDLFCNYEISHMNNRDLFIWLILYLQFEIYIDLLGIKVFLLLRYVLINESADFFQIGLLVNVINQCADRV